MKKLLTLFFLTAICFSLKSNAQINCNLTAGFISQATPTSPFVVYFNNTSSGFAVGDSIRWTFGDGTVSYDLNPVHTFANAGTYTVCLRVKKNTPGTTVPCVSEFCQQVSIVNTPAPCNLAVTFTTLPEPNYPNVIHFTNTSIGSAASDSFTWSFGDGSTSNEMNPVHTYTSTTNPGVFQVCLTVTSYIVPGTAPCVRTSCATIAVIIPVTCNLTASFTSTTTNASSPYVVNFTNTSTGFAAGDSIRWNFGDGTFSNAINPVHTYINAGTYNVCLWVKKNNLATVTPCVSDVCHQVVLTSPPVPCNLNVSFTAIPQANQPNVIQFTNTSTGYIATDSITWTFGDGTSSHDMNPVHTYTISPNTTGTFQVCLTIRRATVPGTVPCVNYSCQTITVQIPVTCNLIANFTSQTGTASSLMVYFTNTSAGFAAGDSIRWTFGDGAVSYDVNPVHTYSTPGVYNVCLRVKKNNNSSTLPCVSEICRQISVSVPPPTPCNLTVNFTAIPEATHPNIIHFTSTSIGYSAGDSITWTFGDGTGSHDLNPVHTYTSTNAAGVYQVCLTIRKNNPAGSVICVNYSCQTITVIMPTTVPNCNNILLSFNDLRDPLMPNRILFVPQSNASITNQIWTITRLPQTTVNGTLTFNQNNLAYTFTDTGSYRVCLHASYAGGCTKEYCKIIHISQLTPPTNACNLHVYPNPAATTVNMNITLAQPLIINGYIYSSSNVLLRTKQQQGYVGNNVFNMNVSTLPAGIYSIKVIYGNQVCRSTFIKL